VDKLRVLLADDHPLMLEGIRGALENEKSIEIVGEATSGAQVLSLLSHAAADLVLLDLRLPDVDGLTCLAWIRQRYPSVKVIMLSVIAEPSEITSALEAGASAYIVKSIDRQDLAAAIRHAFSGTFFCLGGVGRPSAGKNGNQSGLTDRQVEILQAVTRGLTNRAIAREFWLSDQTVKFHLHNIYRTLGVSNRTEATKYAFEHGLADQAT
jgi:DNA-binding NarL/FixJ family response regulator